MTVPSWRLHLFPCQNEGSAIREILRELESQCLSEISAMLNGEIPGQDLGELFFDCVDAEIKFYQWGGETILEIFVSSHYRSQCFMLFCIISRNITSTVSVTAPPGGLAFPFSSRRPWIKQFLTWWPSLYHIFSLGSHYSKDCKTHMWTKLLNNQLANSACTLVVCWKM